MNRRIASKSLRDPLASLLAVASNNPAPASLCAFSARVIGCALALEHSLFNSPSALSQHTSTIALDSARALPLVRALAVPLASSLASSLAPTAPLRTNSPAARASSSCARACAFGEHIARHARRAASSPLAPPRSRPLRRARCTSSRVSARAARRAATPPSPSRSRSLESASIRTSTSDMPARRARRVDA